MVTLKIKNKQQVENYCVRHIGRRLYYIHHMQGGDGWSIKHRVDGSIILTIQDDKKALMAALVLSEYIA